MNILKTHIDRIKNFTSSDQVSDYLMQLGNEVQVDSSIRIRENFVRGCQSFVWVDCEKSNNTVKFKFSGSGKLSLGVCKVLSDALNDKTVEEITRTTFSEFHEFSRSLPINRQRGMQAILNRMHKIAKVS